MDEKRRAFAMNNQRIYEPGLSIGSPDDDINLNNASLGVINHQHRNLNDNSIEEDLFALRNEL